MPTTPAKAPAKSAAKPAPTTAEAPEMSSGPVEPREFPTLAAALAAFQADLPQVRKNQTADVRGREGRASYSYDYADLTDISEAALPALAAVGLAWHTGPDMVDGQVVLRWELLHAASDQVKSGVLPVGRAGADWQSMGSAMTYARRYALTAATGVAPGGDDDDAASAVSAGERQAPVQKPVAAPAEVAYLPAGLYDLGKIATKGDAETMYYTARRAGHLNLVLQFEGEDVAFGDYLRQVGTRLDSPAAPATEPDPDADAIAEHEAFLAGEKNG